jgi:hypothetical protein
MRRLSHSGAEAELGDLSSLKKSYGSVHNPVPFPEKLRLFTTPLEEKQFQDFLKGEGMRGRYQFLEDLQKQTLHTLSSRNSRFGVLLSKLNARRLAVPLVRAIKKKPELKVALLAALEGTEDELIALIPGADRPALKKACLAKLRDTQEKMANERRLRLELHAQLNPGRRAERNLNPATFLVEEATQVARVRLLVEEQLGMTMDHWSLSPDTGGLLFADGVDTGGVRAIQVEIMSQLQNDPDVGHAIRILNRQHALPDGTKVDTQAADIRGIESLIQETLQSRREEGALHDLLTERVCGALTK